MLVSRDTHQRSDDEVVIAKKSLKLQKLGAQPDQNRQNGRDEQEVIQHLDSGSPAVWTVLGHGKDNRRRDSGGTLRDEDEQEISESSILVVLYLRDASPSEYYYKICISKSSNRILRPAHGGWTVLTDGDRLLDSGIYIKSYYGIPVWQHASRDTFSSVESLYPSEESRRDKYHSCRQ